MTRTIAAALVACALATGPARADNAMGYRLLSPEEASQLPHNHGALGMQVGRAEQITDNGMTFDVMQVKAVGRGSAAAAAGFKPGDDLIAVDGRVFPSIAAFGGYVASLRPGQQATVDYIPAGGGPQQAQRVTFAVGDSGRGGQPPRTGMSTGEKVAIGVGAAALLGCYEMGCFSHRNQAPQPVR